MQGKWESRKQTETGTSAGMGTGTVVGSGNRNRLCNQSRYHDMTIGDPFKAAIHFATYLLVLMAHIR